MLRVALLMTALLVGCGQGGPKTYPVAGSVKIKGGTPLGDGTVQLLSEKYTGSGAIQPDGKFTISGLGNDSGVPEGTYKVVIITNEGGIGYGQKKGGVVQVDKKYSDRATTTLEAKVPGGPYDFELDPKTNK